MITRKTSVLAVLTMTGFVAPLAALRPAAQAETAATQIKTPSQNPSQNDLVKAKKDFVYAVHVYNLALVKLYASLAHDESEYQDVINAKKPEALDHLLAPGYTENGQRLTPKQAAAVLDAHVQQYHLGNYFYDLKDAHASFDPRFGSPMLRATYGATTIGPLPNCLDVDGFEHWDWVKRGQRNQTMFACHEVWVAFPTGLKLLEKDEKSLKHVVQSANFR